ncbi:hypothetical protein ACHAWX_005439 [Stephanocyclus meneghinianus]
MTTMPTTISGWTPKTTHLLRCNSASAGGHGGYDIIDHAFGSTFPAQLVQELQSNGWLDDPTRGTTGRLGRARTKMDVDLDRILQLSSLGDDDYRNEKGVRGDESVFISREVRQQDSFPKQYPMLHRLVTCVEQTAFERFAGITNGKSSDSESTYLEFNKGMTSVQLAKYPGNGMAGYPRHCDVGATCRRELNSSLSMKGKESDRRILTFVYYLTPDGWDAELDGGALRIYSSHLVHGRDNVQPTPDYWDVAPFSDRMVVFRSDCIEHQVMPSLRRERIALTIWIYGREHNTIPTITDLLSPTKVKCKTGTQSQLFESPRHCLTSDTSNLPPPLPVFALTHDTQDNHETIFVAIPSYRDQETWPTIHSLIQTAHHPERVYIGVVWQIDTFSPEEVQLLNDTDNGSINTQQILANLKSGWSLETNFRSITMDYRQSTGPCYARHLAQTLHLGEDYVLQIDSHMRFRPNWDAYLIHQLQKCHMPTSLGTPRMTKDSNNKPRAVLTAYPPNYDAPDGPGPNAETRGTVLVPWKFGVDGMLRQKGRLLRPGYTNNELSNPGSDRNDNIPCLLFAAGFNFFHSTLLDCCPYDHKLHGLFFGEEISMAVRLYTHGYDLFSPPLTVCYHQWKRNPMRTRDISDMTEDNRKRLASQKEASLDVVRMQLRGLGRGLGQHRSARQFSDELGVDFDKCSLLPDCDNGKLSAEAFADNSFAGLITVSDHVPSRNTLGMESSEMSAIWNLVNDFIQ